MTEPVIMHKMVHTKVLLKVMDEFRAFNSSIEHGGTPEGFSSGHFENEIIDGKLYVYAPVPKPVKTPIGSFSAVLMGESAVRAELATREHVPNKAESKVIRQRKAKEKANR